MEPQIQYAKTSDGVRIAWAAVGEGKPLVLMPPVPLSWLAGWGLVSNVWASLAEDHRLVTYDPRGCGLSDHGALDFSMEAMLRDFEAVLAQMDAGPFVLTAVADAAPTAVTYAASHSAHLSHLIVCDGWTAFSDWARSPVQEAEASLRESDWHIFTETYARIFWGIEDPVLAPRFGEWVRASCSPEAYRACYAALESYDASPSLARVAVPTLVIHNRRNRWVPLEVGQRIAASIAGTRLVLVDDIAYTKMASKIGEFLGDPPRAAQPMASSLPSGTVVILFADIADSTALTERLGDATFREHARELDGSLRSIIREQSGTPVEGKLLGDGVLALFTSAREAIACARACHAAADGVGLALHVGIHAGDVIREEGNVYGGAVNIAARIADASAPTEVLVSQTVRDLARTSAGVGFEDRGERELKGVGEPVRLFAVRS